MAETTPVKEKIQAGSEVNGQVKVSFVKTIANPAAPKVTELAAGIPITYALTTTGYNHTVTAERLTTGRFTLANALQKEGKITDEIDLTYVYTNAGDDVVTTALPKGTTGFLVERWGIDNGLPFAAGQIVDIIPIEAGEGLKLAPSDNDPELTRKKNINVVGEVLRDVKVVA